LSRRASVRIAARVVARSSDVSPASSVSRAVALTIGLAQARVEPVALAASALEHHDDHREGGQEIERDEHGVHDHVARRPGLHAHELAGDAVHAPQGQHAGQESLAPEADAASTRGPEQDSGRHLEGAQRQTHDALPLVAFAEAVHQGQRRHGAGAHEQTAPAQPIVPPVRDGGGEREPDRRHGRDVGGEARLGQVQDEHVHELQALGQRVRAPGQQQIPEEADAVRGVEVREDEQLDREHDGRDERQHQRHGHHAVHLLEEAPEPGVLVHCCTQ
jgi:hypothetical protein